MKFPLVTYAGVQFRLLLFRPNWEVPPTVNHRLDTQVGEGRTTIEERRPGRATWLLDVALRLTLEGAEADDWRKGLAALGPGRVALPFWPALRPVAAWGTRLYSPQHVINLDPWTGAYALHAADALPAEPAYSHYAPLLLGRFRRRPPAVPATESLADVDLEIAEASPYSWRIDVH